MDEARTRMLLGCEHRGFSTHRGNRTAGGNPRSGSGALRNPSFLKRPDLPLPDLVHDQRSQVCGRGVVFQKPQIDF
jgi:hypothetical protein